MTIRILLSLTCLSLAGCTLGPDYSAPLSDVGDEWFSSEDGEVKLDTQSSPNAWWKQLKDPTLNTLIEQAVEENKDIGVAAANVTRAKALRRMNAAEFYPAIGVGADATKEGISQRGTSSQFVGEKERNSFSTSLDASWEIDLFGRIARSTEAADADYEAAIEERRGVLLATIAELVSNYYQVRGYQKRIAIAERNIELLRETESVAESRFNAGAVSELDLARAQGEREAVEATLPSLRAEMMAGIYRISVLTGQMPESHVATLAATKPLPMPPDQVPVGLRSDLLKRRPDIRQAERMLAASNAQIGVAEANLFPQLSLTGSVGTDARYFSDLFTVDGLAYSIGSAINWSLFEGGALRADIARAEAVNLAALRSYEQTVLLALEETEAALIRYGKEWQTLRRLLATLESRQRAHNIAKLRYEAGEEDFIAILDAERTLIGVRNDIIESETRILVNLTQLYKALGGGWRVWEQQETPS